MFLSEGTPDSWQVSLVHATEETGSVGAEASVCDTPAEILEKLRWWESSYLVLLLKIF